MVKPSEKTGLATNPYQQALRRQTSAVGVVFGFSALINVLMLTGSIYMLQVYDRVLSSGSVPTLVALFSIVVVLYSFLGLFDFLRTRMLSRIAVRLDQSVGAVAFGDWIRSGVRGPNAAGPDAGASRPMRDLETLRGFISSPAAPSLFDLPFVPLFLLALFLIHPWLGLIVVAGVGVAAVLALAGHFLTRAAANRAMSLDGAAQDFTERSRQSAEAIVSMGMERQILARWQKMHDTGLSAQQKAGDPSEGLAVGSRTFRLLLQSAILTVGALLVLKGQISPGMIIASSVLSGRALAPADQIIGQWRSIGRALSAHRGLRDFLADMPAPPVRVQLPAPTGQIAVSRLSKLANGRSGDEPIRVLTAVEFTLEPGDGLGVIGNSGSGKSTLARLLAGAWQADAGEIRFDGATRDQWDPSVLGRSIGYLPQAFDLLPGTIEANIARFDDQINDEDILAAAQLAGVHEMILGLPDGYGTHVGGRGETPLSGGQIQRLGLARAICGMPKIVILDEPNAILDAAGDEALGRAITALRAVGSTVIVMAHRPSAISAVNKVLVLHEGRVACFDEKERVLGPTNSIPGGAAVTPIARPAPAQATQTGGPNVAASANTTQGLADVTVVAANISSESDKPTSTFTPERTLKKPSNKATSRLFA